MQKNSQFPRWLSGREFACQFRRCERCRFDPRAGKFPGVGNGNLIQHSSLENSVDRGSWGATIHGVAKSQTTEHTHKHSHSGDYTLRLSTEGMGKKAPLSLFPWKKLDCTLSQLLPEDQPLTSLHPTADCNPLGHWKVLAHPQPCWQAYGEEGTLIQCWWECKLVKNSGKHCGGSSRN